jgi:MoxR-like ATPase
MSGTSTPAASSPCAVAAFIGDREVAEAALLACPDSDLVRAMPPLRRALAQSPGDGSLSSDVLDSVASLLLIPDLTVSLALGLRPVLLDVTARALADPRVGPEDRLIAMAKILAIAPHAWPLLISHWQRSVCPLSRQRQGVPILPEETCLKVTAAVQTVLTLGPPGTALALEDAWDFSVFADFASSIIGEEQEGDQGSIQLELRARSREILSILLHVFDEMACVYAAIPAGQAMCLSDVEMRQLRLKSLAPKGLQGLISDKHSAMLHPAVHVLGGILHCRCTPAIDGNIGSQKLVMCESTSANVASLSRALAAGGPVLVCGPPGCGKSAILRETARAALGGKESSLLELHLDDTTDSKTLLGAHVCTEVPGEFVWQPGPLAQALAGGRWVLIEDVDRAPPEVLAALVPLMEGKPLVVSGRPHPLTASPGFQLLGTVSSADSYLPATSQPPRIGGAADFGALWSRVQFQSLSETELLGVARGIHHQLSQRAVEALLATFRLCGGRMPGSDATDEEKHSSSGRIRRWIGTRTPSVRDFLKLVARVSASGMKVGEGREGSILCTAKQGELILLEALDVFAGHLPDQQDAAQAARRAAHTWGLREETAHALVTTRMPEMISDGDRRLIGRVVMRLPGVVDGVSAQPNPGSFAKTGLALRLMERLAACVEMGEPALLVGETGCGKTTIVQQLANHVGATLIVQNLSLQTVRLKPSRQLLPLTCGIFF